MRTKPGKQRRNSRQRAPVAERLIGILPACSKKFLRRHGLEEVAITARFHNGHVVNVTHCYSTDFPVPGTVPARRETPSRTLGEGQEKPQSPTVSPAELNAVIHRHLSRWGRHSALRFGTLEIDVEGGAIKTILLAPSFRPSEFECLAWFFSEPCEEPLVSMVPSEPAARSKMPHRPRPHASPRTRRLRHPVS